MTFMEMGQLAADWLCGYRAEPVSALPSVVDIQQQLSVAAEPATKSRRKGLGPKQLKWLRSNIEPFRDMESASKASKEPKK